MELVVVKVMMELNNDNLISTTMAALTLKGFEFRVVLLLQPPQLLLVLGVFSFRVKVQSILVLQ